MKLPWRWNRCAMLVLLHHGAALRSASILNFALTANLPTRYKKTPAPTGLQSTVAVLKNDDAVFSVLAAPLDCIFSSVWADVAGRNNSGAKQIDGAQVCTARKSKAGYQSRSDAMTTKCKYMKGAEFKARQAWLPFVDAAGVVLRILEEVKESATDWFKAWVKGFKTARRISAPEQFPLGFTAAIEKATQNKQQKLIIEAWAKSRRCAQNC